MMRLFAGGQEFSLFRLLSSSKNKWWCACCRSKERRKKRRSCRTRSMTRNNDEGADHQGAGRGGCEGEREEALVAGLTALVALTARHSATHPDARCSDALYYTQKVRHYNLFTRESVSLVTLAHRVAAAAQKDTLAAVRSLCRRCRLRLLVLQVPPRRRAFATANDGNPRHACTRIAQRHPAHAHKTRRAYSPCTLARRRITYKLAPRLTSSPAPAPAPPRRRRSPAPLCPSTS